MPFALAIIGIFLVIAGARGMGNIRQLRDLLVSDFTGENNFFVWIFAIGIVGVFGYLPGMEKLSRAFLVLIFVVLLLATRGSFIGRIQEAFRGAGTGAGGGAASGDAGASTAPGATATPSIESAVNGAFGGLLGSNSPPGLQDTPSP